MPPAASPRVSPVPDAVDSNNDDAATPAVATPVAPTSQASIKSTPKPKLRRKVTVEEALATSTAVQRLVEYFVVVTSQPRWETSTRLQTPDPKGRKKAKAKEEQQAGEVEVQSDKELAPPAAPNTEKKKKQPIVFDTPSQPQRQTTNINPDTLLSPEPLNPPTTKKKPKPLAERFRFRPRETEAASLTRPSFNEDDEKKEIEEGFHEPSSPTPRSEWTREDGPTENIHMPAENCNHSFQPMITARFPLVDHKGKVLCAVCLDCATIFF